MNLPIKCGKMYIKFDENNQPEYGFDVSGNQIRRFVPLTDKKITSIILPRLVESSKFEITSINEKNPDKYLVLDQKMEMQEYISGRVKICNNCFRGLQKARIIVPFENSIMLDWGSFDQNAEIELVTPQNLTLKQIYRTFSTGYDYVRENWTLIGDEKISGEFSFGLGKERYSIYDYNEKDLSFKGANLTINRVSLKNKQNPVQNKEELVK